MAETVSGYSATSNKRPRVDSDDSSLDATESPEAKRLRENLIDILEDESGDRDEATQDLASLMKSFGEEIGLYSPNSVNSLPPPMVSNSGESQPDLGFLLEASDDELGLPPTSSGEENEKGVFDVLRGAPEAVGFDPIWGFGDDLMGSGFGFGFCAEEREEEESVVFGGLFDYPDASSEFSEFSWRTESLPAL